MRTELINEYWPNRKKTEIKEKEAVEDDKSDKTAKKSPDKAKESDEIKSKKRKTKGKKTKTKK
jgi:hypothetical protein